MKLLINTAIIEKMGPCGDRFANWKQYYGNEEHDLASFFALDNITHLDKLWVALRLLPRFEVEVFAIECAVSCAEYDNADYADYAANAAYYTAYYAATYAATSDYADYAAYAAYAASDAAREQVRKEQLEALLYLAEGVE